MSRLKHFLAKGTILHNHKRYHLGELIELEPKQAERLSRLDRVEEVSLEKIRDAQQHIDMQVQPLREALEAALATKTSQAAPPPPPTGPDVGTPTAGAPDKGGLSPDGGDVALDTKTVEPPKK
jgi:hypothetical protein